MDYTYKYFYERSNYKDILYWINRVRMDKGLFLPFELVGIDRIQLTNTFYNNKEQSAVRQKFIQNQIETLTAKDYQLQNKFKQWLITKPVQTMYNFKAFGESRMNVTNNLRFIRYKAHNNTQCHERVNEGSNEFQVLMNLIENVQWIEMVEKIY